MHHPNRGSDNLGLVISLSVEGSTSWVVWVKFKPIVLKTELSVSINEGKCYNKLSIFLNTI